MIFVGRTRSPHEIGTQIASAVRTNKITRRVVSMPYNLLLAIRRSKSRSQHVNDLSQNGYRVVTADNGIECLEILKRFLPDFVILEPEFLRGAGNGVLTLLRETPDLRDVPVLILTTDCNWSVA